MIFSNDNKIFTIPIDKEKATIDDGRFMLDTSVFPSVCPRCGAEGNSKQRLRIKAPYDWKFWIAIGGFLGGPILFGLCAAIISLAFGDKALQEFLPYGVGIAIFLAAFGGLRMSGSSRENWFLTFYFCNECGEQNKKLTYTGRIFIWVTILLLLAMLAIAVVNPALHITQQSLQTLVTILLGAAILGVIGIILNRIQRSNFRGLTARWVARKPALRIKIKNPQSLEITKSKVTTEERKMTVA